MALNQNPTFPRQVNTRQMEQRTQKTDLDLIREQKPEEMMSAASCGMQDEKTHEKKLREYWRKRAQNLKAPGRTSTDRMKEALWISAASIG